MFKCVECGAEYKIKPDYCDCGNDMFELVDDISEIEIPETPQIKINSPTQQETYINSFNNTPRQSSNDPISIIVFLFCILLSVITVFFIGNPKETPNDQQKTPTQTASQNVQNIPSVESFWDNSTEGIKQNNIIAQNLKEIIVKTEEQPKPTQVQPKETVDPFTAKFEKWLNQPSKYEQEPVKNTVSQPVKPTTQPTKTNAANNTQIKTQTPAKTTNTLTTQTQQAKKQTQANNSQKDLISRIQKQYNTTTTNTTATKTQTVNNNQTKTTSPAKTITQNTNTNTTQTKTTNNSRPTDPLANSNLFNPSKTTTTTNTNTTTTKTATTTPAKTTTVQTAPKVRQGKSAAQLSQELSTYKASLRNNIGKKINFANIVGDGSCAITFTINSSGKLTNRKFSQQSTNITLNDAVYSAMMATPSYNPPPEGYKNETLTFYVKIYNGNYEISLK